MIDEFSRRCNERPELVSRARSWNQDGLYWKSEERHFAKLVDLLDDTDLHVGDDSGNIPDMDWLERSFRRYDDTVRASEARNSESKVCM